MSLDLFDPTPALQNAQNHLASDLPADFSEAFDVSTRAMTEWNSSVNYGNARDRALATFYDDVKARTGVQLPLYGMGGNVSLDELNEAIVKLPQDPKQPEQSYRPLSENDIDTMALTRMRAAHDDAAAFSRRETSWGGTLGSITGTLAAGVSDPVALATLPLGGAGQAGIAFRALEFALIGAGTEAAIAGAGASSREAAVPGSLREMPGEIASAALFGGIFGAGIGGLQKLAGTGARTLPVTVRDEVHAATSEAQLNLTNPFPTAAGEAAARDATIEATRSAVRGEPVRVGDDFAPAHVADYALAAEAKTPEELAIAGEKHLRPETYGLEPEVERFDRMPTEADDVASYWDKRLEGASADERAALGATDAGGAERGLRLVEAPEGGIYTPDQIKTGRGERYFKVYNSDDDVAAEILVRVKGDTARIEDILVPGKPREEGRNALGAADLRSVLRQFQEANPEIKTLTGKRVSGARMEGGYDLLADPTEVSVNLRPVARDLSPTEMAALDADPKTLDAAAHDLDHVLAANPDAEFSTQVRMPDGSYQFTTQKLSDVLKELDEFERAGKELEACVIGLEAAE
ncbi:hypothetical protein QWJ07_31275 [Frankia sp. RB7]|nr:hypothetical protein [Frankia sp. RB7]